MITKEDVVELLNSLMNYDYKDYKYELIIEENRYLGEVNLWIVKYNYIEYLENLNKIINGDRGIELRNEFMYDRIKNDRILKIANCLFYVGLRVMFENWRKGEDFIIRDLFKNFMKSLDVQITTCWEREKKMREIKDETR